MPSPIDILTWMGVVYYSTLIVIWSLLIFTILGLFIINWRDKRDK